MNASQRAMLASLKISAWSAKRYDRKATAQVAQLNGTHTRSDAGPGRYNKNLLFDATSYAALGAVCNEIRAAHYENTLPWHDDGARILPVANWQKHSDAMRQGRLKFEQALAAFLADYPRLRQDAEHYLGGLYNPQDYPTVEELAGKYGLEIDYENLPSGEDMRRDFRLALAEDELAAIASDTDSRIADSLAAAQKAAVDRLREVLARMAVTLSDPKAIFRDTLITNAREVCETLVRLNLAGDLQLENFRQQAETLASGVTPQGLRNSKYIREQAAREASSIIASMDAFYGERSAQNAAS